MKLFNSITRTASTPPWAQVINLDGVDGFWVDTNLGSKVFLRQKDQVIWLPRTLRGKKIQDLTPEELKAVPKEDSGKTHFEQWHQGYTSEQTASKLYNGYSFTPRGLAAVQRLQKLVEKYELDNVANIGMESKYSINPAVFERLAQCNTLDAVRRIGRLIAKKFATIIHLLNQVNPKLATRLDKDFMFGYTPLEGLFAFDVTEFKPNIEQPEPIEATTLKHIYLEAATKMLEEAKPLLIQNTACVQVLQGFKKILKLIASAPAIDQETMHHIELLYIQTMHGLVPLMSASGMQPELANVSQIAHAVSQLQSLRAFHDIVFGGVDDNQVM